jgi:hypothetical protein
MDVGMTLQASPLFRHQRSLVPYGVLSKFATPSPRSQGHCLPTRIRARIRPAIQPTDGHYRQWMDQRSFVAICIILAQPRQRLNSQVRFTIWYGVAKEIRVRRWLVIDAATCHKVCVCSKSHLTSVMIRPGAPPSSIVREHTHTPKGKRKKKERREWDRIEFQTALYVCVLFTLKPESHRCGTTLARAPGWVGPFGLLLLLL